MRNTNTLNRLQTSNHQKITIRHPLKLLKKKLKREVIEGIHRSFNPIVYRTGTGGWTVETGGAGGFVGEVLTAHCRVSDDYVTEIGVFVGCDVETAGEALGVTAGMTVAGGGAELGFLYVGHSGEGTDGLGKDTI